MEYEKNPSMSKAPVQLQSEGALTLADSEELVQWDRHQGVIRDRVRGAAQGYATGLYLSGRPGTGKTHTVLHTLEDDDVSYHYHCGHLTPHGLFELLGKNHDRVIVLDDVAFLLGQPVALQYLLAALAQPTTGDRTRVVRYQKQGHRENVCFDGAIIFISNPSLHTHPLHEALRSRVQCMQYDPSDAQMVAIMRSLAGQGWSHDGKALVPAECVEVAEYVIAESVRLSVPLNLRLLFDKAYPDYLQYREGHAETHWRDLVTTTLRERLSELPNASASGPSPLKLRLANDRQVAREIRQEFPEPSDQVKAWEERTRQSRRTYFRRLKETEPLEVAASA